MYLCCFSAHLGDLIGETEPHPPLKVLFIANKSKTETLAFMEIKNFCASKNLLLKSENAENRMGGNMCKLYEIMS